VSADDYTSGWHVEGDELVSRLSRLEWAPVPDELRERCWQDFEQRMSQNGNGKAESGPRRPAFNVGERYEMRRFAPARRLAVAELPGRGLTASGRGLVSSARLAASQVGRTHTPRRALSLG
jgi:hypothetical protein